MALTVEVTKVWPTVNPTNEDYTISLQVSLSDAGVQVLQETFSCDVNKNDVLTDASGSISRILVKVNAWIAKYKKEKVAFNHAAYETIRAGVASGVSL